MTLGLDAAITKRGGLGAVRRKSRRGRAGDIELAVEGVAAGRPFAYAVSITAGDDGDWDVKREFASCEDAAGRLCKPRWSRRRAEGLALPFAGDAFGPARDLLRSIGAYTIHPDRLRDPQPPLPPGRLADEGANFASVLKRMPGRGKSAPKACDCAPSCQTS